jgi:hypothetical protein
VNRGTVRVLWVTLQIPCVLAFIGYRIAAAVAEGGPGVWQDSEGYRAVAASPWFSLRLWAGSRAPLTPVLMKLTGSYLGYGIAQSVLGALAWAFLAYTASRLVRTSWRKPLVTVLVLGFAASPLVVMWDGQALSESPSLSVLALIWACGIWLVRRFTRVRLAAFGMSVLLYCGLRDADIYTFGLLGFVLLGLALFWTFQGAASESDGGRARIRANWNRAHRLLAVGGVLLGISAFTGTAAWSAHRNPNLEDAFAVRIFPYPARVGWFASQGMPELQAIDALAAATPRSPTAAPIVEPDFALVTWGPLKEWFSTKAQTTYDLYLLLHPWYDLTAPFASPHLTFNDANGSLTGYFPTGYPVAWWLGDLFNPNRVVELLLGLAAVVVAGVRRVWRLPQWRFTALFALTGLWSMLLSWHGEGMEVTRHMVEGNVEVRLGVLLSVAMALISSRPAAAASEADDGQEMAPVQAPDTHTEVFREPVSKEPALTGPREGTAEGHRSSWT